MLAPLSDKSALKTGDLKWYFFCPVEKKYSNGARMNRATEIGYWKTTGKDRPVNHKEELVGWIKTLVFHTGKAPKGERTNWVMHEYRLEDKNLPETAAFQVIILGLVGSLIYFFILADRSMSYLLLGARDSADIMHVPTNSMCMFSLLVRSLFIYAHLYLGSVRIRGHIG